MSNLISRIRDNARAARKTIVLPEGDEPRTIQAAKEIVDQGIARLIMIGKKHISHPDITVIDPATADLTQYADLLYQLRQAKGLTREDAAKLVLNPLYLGALIVKSGQADGMTAGALNTTGDVLRPALQIIKTAPGISTVSSCFVMVMPDSTFGEEGALVFGDCAVMIDPTPSELADIAMASAESARNIVGIQPRVALLSFSTHGSGKHALVTKVADAVAILTKRQPAFEFDGELQADAALVESVAAKKAPSSQIAGRANVLIFPDLQSGNIGYKLVERLARAEAVGPICQGFAQPVNDLSRGCSVTDIVNVVAITAVQAIK